MADADTKFPVSRQIFAWSFAAGVILFVVTLAATLVGIVVTAIRGEQR